MNKNLWIGVGVAVVIIIAGVFLFKGNNNTQAPSSENGSQGALTDQKSLKDLFSMQGSRQCTFDDSTGPVAAARGTVYIADGKMRGDFTTVADGKTTAAHMIVANNVAYTWIDGMSTGFKVGFDKMQAQSQTSAKGVDVDKKINYDCSSWISDSSKFSLPAGITFSDMSAYLPGGGVTASGTTSGAPNCSACDSVPASYKAQCRASLGCK